MNWKVISAIVVLLVVAGFVWFVVDRSANSDYNEPVSEQDLEPSMSPKVGQVKETLAVESEEDYQEEADKAPAPPKQIDGSDQQVREAAGELSPTVADWLVPQHQVRKWVAMIDQMAGFRLPNKNLPVQYPKEPFLVIKTEKGIANDPGNYRR